MRPMRGRVRGGVVRIVQGATLPEGQRVLVIPLPPERQTPAATTEIAAEDLEFVRACRRRLAAQLESEDAHASD